MPPALITLLVWAAGIGAAVWGVSEAAEKAADSADSVAESVTALSVAAAGSMLTLFGAWALYKMWGDKK